MLFMNKLLFLSLLALGFLTPHGTNAQQNYSGNSALECHVDDSTGPNPAFLYTCNGRFQYCQAFLIFKAQPPFNSVPTISTLTSSDQQDLAKTNNVTRLAEFPTDKEVIAPVKCSCLGKYYQANTSLQVASDYFTYYVIATKTFEGLSTCPSLLRENLYGENDLMDGTELKVPLRCACPTRNQIVNGTRYLLTYPVSLDDTIPNIAERFNVSVESLIEANGLDQDPIIYPETTILIPLPGKPLSSQTIIHNSLTENSPPPVSSLQPLGNPTHKSSKRKLYKIVGIAAACSLLVLSVILVVVIQLCRRSSNLLGNCGKKKTMLSKDLHVEIASFEKVLRVFGIEEIKKATENFSPVNRIKGSVYSGNFGGDVFAVKKVNGDASKEVNILKRTNHFNLIKLHGVCEFYGCFFLVFEYMKNGSLREWLSNQRSKEEGSWNKRVQIALDVANGIYYLHSFTKPAYVHKDIRSSNVLLTGDLRAKISNFSLARAAESEAANATLTNHVIGTRGYMAPEYLQSGEVTPKIDVYAFGVVLLELITGKDAVFTKDGKEALLSTTIVTIFDKENAEADLASFIDPGIEKGNWEAEAVLRLARLSLACLKKDPARRPSMAEVVSVLVKIQADLPVSESTVLDATNEEANLWCPSMGETVCREESISF